MLELKAGQKIAVTLYQGNNNVEARALLDYLKGFKESEEPIPLQNTIFHIKIENVFLKHTGRYPWGSKDEMVHKVIIRGELLECRPQVSQ